MANRPLRKDQTCLNCNHVVEKRFCSNCGQENVEKHQSVKELLATFFKDLFNYDNSFWKTIRYLLFQPSKLSKIYLEGKRKRFVPPIRLYIFISFIAFLLPTLLPELKEDIKNKKPKTALEFDSGVDPKDTIGKQNVDLTYQLYDTVKELDSIQNSLPEDKKLSPRMYYGYKKYALLKENYTTEQLSNKFIETFYNNLPKALFIYLPLFGFFLWLFHSKKKWFFFDHAVFTLHYFSFMLLTLTISVNFIERFFEWVLNDTVYEIFSNINGVLTILWIIICFYIAHKRMYNESTLISIIKSTILFFINSFFILLILIGLGLITFLTLE